MSEFESFMVKVGEAETTMSQANRLVEKLAYLCRRRLRTSGVGHGTLCDLKRELSHYNMHRARWKDE